MKTAEKTRKAKRTKDARLSFRISSEHLKAIGELAEKRTLNTGSFVRMILAETLKLNHADVK